MVWEYILLSIILILGFLCFYYRCLISIEQKIYQNFLPKRQGNIFLAKNLDIFGQYQEFKSKRLFFPLSGIDAHMQLLKECHQHNHKIIKIQTEELAKAIFEYLIRYAEDVLLYIELQDRTEFNEIMEELKLNISLSCKTRFPKLGKFGIALEVCNPQKKTIEIFHNHSFYKELVVSECSFSNTFPGPFVVSESIQVSLGKLELSMKNNPLELEEKVEKKYFTYHIKILDVIIHSRSIEIEEKLNILSLIQNTVKS